jgi:hypothetical protein
MVFMGDSLDLMALLYNKRRKRSIGKTEKREGSFLLHEIGEGGNTTEKDHALEVHPCNIILFPILP